MQAEASTSRNAEIPDENFDGEGRRLRKKRKSEVSACSVEETAVQASQKKRAGKQRKAGRLSNLMVMPLDILFEIFGHLLPLDILNLARTTKEFRRILMHRSSLSIWKAARGNVSGSFPDCPPDMTEPQWANLAFDPHCNVCLTPNIRAVDWALRVRLCKKCIKENVIEHWDVCGGEDGPVSWANTVPSRYDKRCRLFVYLPALDSVREKHRLLESSEARQAFVNKRKELNQAIKKHATLCEKWAVTKAQDRTQELEDARQSRKEAIFERLGALGWGEEIEKMRPSDALTHHRLVRDPKHLTERIWKNISAPLVAFMEERNAERLARERTQLIIDRKRPAVTILRAYKNSHLPCLEVMPGPVDFCAFPEIKAVLELPSEVTVDETSFAEVVPLLPEIFSKWRADINHKLVAHVKDQLYGSLGSDRSDEAVVEKMKLATTVFKCTQCTSNRYIYAGDSDPWMLAGLLYDAEFDSDADDFYDSDDEFGLLFSDLYSRPQPDKSNPLFYPRVLGHHCLMRSRDSWRWHSDSTVTLDCMPLSRGAWSTRPLKVNETAGEIVKEIVKACDLDPATTTADELDELDPRLGCLNCVYRGDAGLLEVFGWRSAVQHHGEKHTLKCPLWEMLTGSKREEALCAEALRYERLRGQDTMDLPADLVVWSCAHCRDLSTERKLMHLDDVKAHVSIYHDISDAKINEDYFEDYEGHQAYRTNQISRWSTITTEAKTTHQIDN